MADADAEAAFLKSMQVMNEGVGEYMATGGVSEQQIDSSSDEYDPSHEVQEVSVSSGLQDPTDQVPSSLGSLKNDILRPVPSSSQAPNSAVIIGMTTSAANANQQSRPSSRTPISSTDPQNPPEDSHDDYSSTGRPSGQEKPQSGMNGVQPFTNESEEVLHRSQSSTPPNHMSTEDVSMSLTNHDRGVSEIAQNGSNTNLVPNLAAIIPDTGAAAHPSTVAKSAETLSTPKLVVSDLSSTNTIESPSSTAPKARLPHDKIGILEDRIKEDETGDLDAWLGLVGEHRRRGKLEDARKVYERFLVLFPTAVSILCHQLQIRFSYSC